MLSGPPQTGTNKHYEQLDGLRGIAALSVVFFHFMEMFLPPEKNFFVHGFLAVDFFFCLSGFVMAYAYDHRFPGMTLKAFFTKRLIRLHPLVVLGTLLGVVTYFLDPFSPANTYSWRVIALAVFTSFLMIPYPFMKERAFNLFIFNAPAWSLFWEYVANIVYVLVLRRLKNHMLVVLAILFAFGLFYIGKRSGTIVGGWSAGTFWDGSIRVGYSFTMGMLLLRFGWKIKNKLGFPVLALLLVCAFLLPYSSWDFVSEPLVVVAFFPFIILLGVGMQEATRGKKAIAFLGNISYPLYMTHYGFIWIFGSYYAQYHPDNGTLAILIPLGVLALVLLAAFISKFVDTPIRRWLSGKIR